MIRCTVCGLIVTQRTLNKLAGTHPRNAQQAPCGARQLGLTNASCPGTLCCQTAPLAARPAPFTVVVLPEGATPNL